MSQVSRSRLVRWPLVLLAAALSAATANPVDELQAAIADVAARVKPAVVRIVAERAQPAELLDVPVPLPDLPRGDAESRGSGMIFRQTGDAYYILTNAHVVRESPTPNVRIKLIAERETRSGVILGYDLRTDTAVIKMDRREGEQLPLVTFAPPDSLRVGSLVLAVGSPFDFEASITMGIVSSLDRQLEAPDGVRLDPRFRETYRGLIQTDASINPGNSGGPLVNLRGEVVGINFAIYAPGFDRGSVGIGFAQPIERSLLVLEDLIATGHAVRGYLGIGIQDISDAATRLEVPLRDFEALLATDAGAYVSEVTPDSPGGRAGLEAGDVIVGVDGTAVDSVGRLQDRISAAKPGATVRLEVLRAGARLPIEATVGAMPAGPGVPEPPVAEPPPPAAEEQNALQVTVAEVPADMAAALETAGGVAVAAAVPSGPGARAGLTPGTVVLSGRKVGGERVELNDVAAFEEFVADAAVDGGLVQFWIAFRVSADQPTRRLCIVAQVPRSEAGR